MCFLLGLFFKMALGFIENRNAFWVSWEVLAKNQYVLKTKTKSNCQIILFDWIRLRRTVSERRYWRIKIFLFVSVSSVYTWIHVFFNYERKVCDEYVSEFLEITDNSAFKLLGNEVSPIMLLFYKDFFMCYTHGSALSPL